MEQVGYKLIDENSNVVEQWGGVWGQCPGIPNPIRIPNGDIVYGPSLNTDYSGCKLVVWMMEPPPEEVPASITRRQAALQLLYEGFINTQEAVDMARTAAIPAFINAQFSAMTPDQQTKSQIDFAASQYFRDNLLLSAILSSLGETEEQLDRFFIAAGKL